MHLNHTWKFRPVTLYTERRVPINIAPEVRARLQGLLMMPELQSVGYTAFIDRACEIVEGEIINLRAAVRD